MFEAVNPDPRQRLLAVRAGDQNAFGQLYEQYLPLIDRLTDRFLPSFAGVEEAEDIRQEAALALYQAALAYRLEQNEVEFGLFAKICMTNRIIDKLRAQNRLVKTEVYAEDDEESVTMPDPSAYLLDAEAVASINQVIDRSLSAYERRVFKLYLSGCTAREIARIAGKDEKSVTNAVYRIRRKLKTLLQS